MMRVRSLFLASIVLLWARGAHSQSTGFVQVCKVAGAGITVGTNFTFSVGGTPVVVSAGAGPGGTCGTPVTVTAGTAVITETIPTGVLLTGVSTLPSAGLLVGSNLAAGTATVTVNSGAQTTVTFVDQTVVTPSSVSNIPALSTWGMLVLAGLLAFAGLWTFRKA
jgi:hypothetical protein